MLAAWATHARSETQPLVQKPIIQITGIHHWTSLANNDTASHLLSLYFTWENPTWQLIDKEMFVRDLECGHGKFCSALLVTVLLFFGCVRVAIDRSEVTTNQGFRVYPTI